MSEPGWTIGDWLRRVPWQDEHARQRYAEWAGRIDRQQQDAAEHHQHQPFHQVPPDGTLTGDTWIGNLPDGRPVKVPSDALNGITIVCGDRGTGKSTWADFLAWQVDAAGPRCILLETKLPPAAMRRNPLPELSAAEAAISIQAQALLSSREMAQMWWRMVGHVMLIQFGIVCLEDAYQRATQTAAGGEVCLAQLLPDLQVQTRTRPRGRPGAHGPAETAYMVCRRICDSDAGLFSSLKTVPLEHRFEHSHLINITGASLEAQRLFLLIMAFALMKHNNRRGFDDRTLRHLLIADDARLLIADNHRPGEVSAFQTLFDLAHSAGVGIVVMVQSLADLTPDMVEQAGMILLIGKQTAADVGRLSRRMRLNNEQRMWLQREQAPHNGILHLRSHHQFPLPFPITLLGPKVLHPLEVFKPYKEQAKAALMGSYQPVLWTPPAAAGSAALAPKQSPAPPESKASPSVAQPALRLLEVLLDHPYLIQSEAYDVLKLRHGAAGLPFVEDLRKQLEGSGYLNAHKRANRVALEVTESGAAAVSRPPWKPPGRGGFFHSWLLARLQRHYRSTAADIQLEYAWEGRRFDLYVRFSDSTCLIIEVMLSLGNLKETLDKLASYRGGTPVIIVESSQAQRKVHKAAADQQWASPLKVKLLQAVIAETAPVGEDLK